MRTGGATRVLAGLVRASHPGPSLAVTGFAATVAATAGARVALVAAATLAGQLSVGWCNDWVDRRVDAATRRAEKPIVTGAVPARVVGGGAVAALAVCALLSYALGAAAGTAHLVAVGWAWAYNLGLKRTVVSVLPYAVAFGLVPACFVALSLPGSPWPRWPVVAASALLGASAHFTNTIKDVEADRRTGLRGLPQRIGPVASAAVSAVLLGGAAALLLVGSGAASPVSLVAAGVGGALAVAYCGLVLVGRRDAWAFGLNVAAVGCVLVGYVAAGSSLTP